MSFERELVKQRVLLDLPIPHHRLPPAVVIRDYTATAADFFNNIGHDPALLSTDGAAVVGSIPAVSRPGDECPLSSYSSAKGICGPASLLASFAGIASRGSIRLPRNGRGSDVVKHYHAVKSERKAGWP
jgi:hypothetical protein